MEGARDLAQRMQSEGKGRVLDQFGNDDNWISHYEGTGPEIWRDTQGTVTHFVSAMGTTGTITGVSRYLKEQSEAIQIIGAEPADGASIPGIRKWPEAYLPAIYRHARVDRVGRGEPARCGEHGAAAGCRGRHLLRDLGRRRMSHSARPRRGMAPRASSPRRAPAGNDCLHRVRPRRPLSVDGCFPGLSDSDVVPAHGTPWHIVRCWGLR